MGVKRPMTDEQCEPILKSVHMIGVLAEVIKVEHRDRIFDTRFKSPNMNNHANKIIQSCDQLQKDLAFQFKLKDRERMQYQEALQLWRIIDHFVDCGAERMEEFMDLVDKSKKDGTITI